MLSGVHQAGVSPARVLREAQRFAPCARGSHEPPRSRTAEPEVGAAEAHVVLEQGNMMARRADLWFRHPGPPGRAAARVLREAHAPARHRHPPSRPRRARGRVPARGFIAPNPKSKCSTAAHPPGTIGSLCDLKPARLFSRDVLIGGRSSPTGSTSPQCCGAREASGAAWLGGRFRPISTPAYSGCRNLSSGRCASRRIIYHPQPQNNCTH